MINLRKFIDLTGQKFGRLTVVKRTDNYVTPKGTKHSRWLCECDCGNPNLIAVTGTHLKTGHTQSCGCYKADVHFKTHKKYNLYDLSGEYGIGYTSNTKEPFYFDLEDYNLINKYSWSINKDGYIAAYIDKNNPVCYIHRLVMQTNQKIDHINHNKSDNRKCNLREATSSQNGMNKELLSRNTSGVTGVDWMPSIKKWRARITVNGAEIHLGVFDEFEDAVKARKDGEEKYFGEFSYDNSMNIEQIKYQESLKK